MYHFLKWHLLKFMHEELSDRYLLGGFRKCWPGMLNLTMLVLVGMIINLFREGLLLFRSFNYQDYQNTAYSLMRVRTSQSYVRTYVRTH